MANDLALPRSRELQRDLLRRQAPWAALSAAVYAAYVVLLLQLPDDLWLGFLQHLAVVAVGTFVVAYFANRRYFEPLSRYLDARGEAGETERRAAFEAVLAVPRRLFVAGLLAATLGGALLAASLMLRFDGFRPFSALVIQAAAISAGLISVIFNHFATERALAPVRSAIALELGNAAARGRLVKRVKLRTKVFCSVAGVTIVTLPLGFLLQQVRSDLTFERHVAEVQLRYLRGLTAEPGSPPGDLSEAAQRAGELGIADAIVRLGAADGGTLPPGLGAGEAAFIRSRGAQGVSTELDSSHVFAWVADPEGDGWLVATVGWNAVHGNPLASRLSLLGLLAAALALSLLLAGGIAAHVGDATLAIHAEAERVAAGNLRSQRPFESDDELGDLGRSFEHMIEGLRRTIGSVAEETNLLALNAAIIAAQSGESGRAFSVVADQIKELADRVLDSTKEIGGLIRGVQNESRSAIGAIERGSESVQNGVSLAAEAGLSLEEITSSAKQTEVRAEEIVGAVRQQSAAAAHVVELMDGVQSGVQQIRTSGVERQGGTEMIVESAGAMRDVAKQVHATTREQAVGARRIRESISSIQSATEAIDLTLRDQARACQEAADFLIRIFDHTRVNDESAQRMGETTQELLRQAGALREEMGRFRL